MEKESTLNRYSTIKPLEQPVEHFRSYLLTHYWELYAFLKGKELDNDVVGTVLHSLFEDKHLCRLAIAYKSGSDLLCFIKGCLLKDRHFGLYTQRRLKLKWLNAELPVFEDGSERSIDFIKEWEQGPQAVFEAAEKIPLELDLVASLPEQITRYANHWAGEDEPKNGSARKARSIVYSMGMQAVLQAMHDNKPALTPSKKLRVTPGQRRAMAIAAKRTGRTVRSYLRDLEPRLTGLING